MTVASQSGRICGKARLTSRSTGKSRFMLPISLGMSNLVYDSDICGSVHHSKDLLSTPRQVEAGYSHPPDGPGLEVEVDRAK